MILGPDGKPVDVEPCPLGIEPSRIEKAGVRFAARSVGFDGPRDCAHGLWYCERCRWMGGYSRERVHEAQRPKRRIE